MRAYAYRIIAAALLLLTAVSSVSAGGFTASIWSVAWSPDGKSLLYTVFKDGVYIANLDGETQRILDADSAEWTPQWSPDGKSIITTMTVDNQAGIFRVPLKDGEPKRLTEDVGWRPEYYAPNGMQPRYSPDGKFIAFLSLREGDENTSLYLMTADGNDEHPLSRALEVQDFVWSPDSQSIALLGSPDSDRGHTDLYSVSLDGKIQIQLTITQDVDDRYTPAWTPDGEHILFTASTADNKGRIEIVDAVGQNRKVFREHGSEPIFSPDGTYILFTSPAEHWFNLSIMSADSAESDVTTITLPGERAYYGAAWSPDNSQIAFVSFLFDAPKSESITLVNADGGDPRTLVSLPIS